MQWQVPSNGRNVPLQPRAARVAAQPDGAGVCQQNVGGVQVVMMDEAQQLRLQHGMATGFPRPEVLEQAPHCHTCAV